MNIKIGILHLLYFAFPIRKKIAFNLEIVSCISFCIIIYSFWNKQKYIQSYLEGIRNNFEYNVFHYIVFRYSLLHKRCLYFIAVDTDTMFVNWLYRLCFD